MIGSKQKFCVLRGLLAILLAIVLSACSGGGAGVNTGGGDGSSGATGGSSDGNSNTSDGNGSSDQSDAGQTDAGADGSSGSDGGSGADGSDGSQPTAGSFELRVDATNYELVEANPNGIVVPIYLDRNNGHISPVEINVQTVESMGSGFSAEIDQSVLQGSETNTNWRAVLGVSIGPVMDRDLTFTITASDGEDERNVSFTVSLSPISAPDVYLLIGQSNMEGYSEPGSKDKSVGGPDAMNSRIRQLNVRENNRSLYTLDEHFTDESRNTVEPRYITAEDPLHYPKWPDFPDKNGDFIGPGLSFAKAALPNTTQEIMLVPAAWAATGFCGNADPPLAWMAEAEPAEPALGGTLLVERALTRLNMTLRDSGGVFRGILWHQGESDSRIEACSLRYENNLVNLVERLRTDASVDARGESARGPAASIPFVLGTMSRGQDERADFSNYDSTKQRIDDAHRNIPNIIPYASIVINDDLVPPGFPCGAGDCVHFGAAAYREMGVRYFSAMQQIQSQ